MKKTRKILSVVFIIMLIITIIVINRTYALFESNVDFSINMDIAKWNIAVNDTAVMSNTVETFLIKNLTLQPNSKVVDGKVAPGSQGTFEVEIDFKDTDVSVQCEIVLDSQRIADSGVSFSGFTVDDNDITVTHNSDTNHSMIIPLSKIKHEGSTDSYKITMQIAFEWTNDESRNKEDTLMGTSATRLKMDVPISIKFMQYVG